MVENDFLLVYASQTGQAEAIAEDFYLAALNDGLSPRLHCISDNEKEFHLEKESCVVFIVSTTGEGEPPEKALKFWRKIKRSLLPANHFAFLSFTVLGLGDTNYTNFCNFGKMLSRRLEELGASNFSESMWADDGIGLEVVVEPWKEKTLCQLKHHFGTNQKIKNDTCVDIQITNVPVSEIDNATQDSQNLCSVSSSEMVIKLDNEFEEMQIRQNQYFDSKSLPLQLKLDAHQNGIKLVDNLVKNENHQPAIEKSMIPDRAIIDSSSDLGPCQQDLHSLTHSSMNELPLTLPLSPPRFLRVNFLPGENSDPGTSKMAIIQSGFSYPGAKSPVSQVPIISAKRLTHHNAVKTTLQIDLDMRNCDWSYEPGDTIAVICPNDVTEVNCLLDRLGLKDISNKLCYFDLLPNTQKKNARVPEFLQQNSTISEVLSTCCEIREPPRKVFLRALVDFTEDPFEKRRLQELCSKQGSDDFAKFIREPNLSLLDILTAFPSCKPPIDVIFENLPRLQPRAYSAASSPLAMPGCLRFVFNILHFKAGEGRTSDRDGVCTGWLNTITRHLQRQQLEQKGYDELKSETAIKNNLLQLQIFLRTNRFFHLPSDLSIPLVMIGPGTGVSPFIGFLQHRSKMISNASSSASIGATWLFYGCRSKDLDFLFKEELDTFVSDGILTKLLVSHSRDSPLSDNCPRYVQDNMMRFGEELVALIYERNAQVYVCGDAKGMSPDVYRTFKNLLVSYRGMDEISAESFMTEMRVQKRYLEDVWV